jgi:hypothetical protein
MGNPEPCPSNCELSGAPGSNFAHPGLSAPADLGGEKKTSRDADEAVGAGQ